MEKLGKDLMVGDTLAVWWKPQRDTIIGLKPYTGPLAHIFPEGAQIAEFAIWKLGMTIENDGYYEILSAAGGQPLRLTQGEAPLHHPAPECEGVIAA